MRKGIQSISLFLIILLVFSSNVMAGNKNLVRTNSSKVLVDGVEKSLMSYNIKSNNYFKLRDIAYLLNGSRKQFNVEWDRKNNAINLLTGKTYMSVGSECKLSTNKKIRTFYKSKSKISKDNRFISLDAYNINSNNYFKLRDLGQAFDFAVVWNGKKNIIEIKTDLTYKQGKDLEEKLNNRNKEKSETDKFEDEVWRLVNIERKNYGLKPLKKEKKLMELARMKSQDMVDNNYFDHYSPTYGSIGEMLSKYGVPYMAVGENIAWGQRTPKQVVEGWMNSPGHRANILNSNYGKIGIGLAKDSSGVRTWTQLFTN